MFTCPKTKQSYLFLAPIQCALARLLLESTPGVQCSETLLRSSPTLQTLQTLQTLVPPDHSPLYASIRWPGQAGLTSAGSVAAGSDSCLLGRSSLLLWECRVCAFVLLMCFSCCFSWLLAGRIPSPVGNVVYVLWCCWRCFFLFSHCTPQGA